MMLSCMFAKFLLLGATFLAMAQSHCPDVQPMRNLNITEYTRASWYVQEQQVTAYQSEEQLRCVVATYDAGYSKWWQQPPFFTGSVLSVYNHYADGKPTLNERNQPVNRLCASVKNRALPSKLLVAPCFLPLAAGGDYWVIGVGSSRDGHYEWAVVSGGRARKKYADGCTTDTGYFNSGLWIFSRTPVLAAAKLAEARSLLRSMGYTLSLMKSVSQTGCSYAGAYLKR
eukprot:TRINITY_DN49024_c0_g1_i1.p1 TRINITY_DN49024_c0_g1~~TRINITY_DN49024_c0_g1_i1.p1  ORF type:complete len:228 (-),score=40.64 TRINITY_DN49024_c0_g1_i1:416-1099(-)